MGSPHGQNSSYQTFDDALEDREDTDLLRNDDGDQDGLLPRHTESSPNPAQQQTGAIAWMKRRWFIWRMLALLTFGTFLATCPVPRQHVSHVLRLLLMAATTGVFLARRPSRWALGSKTALARRLFVASLGLGISVYAFFGVADELHLEFHLRSLLWIHDTWGYTLHAGYLTRLFLAGVAWLMLRASGIYSTAAVLKMWGLCFVWVYADLPLTIFDLMRQREHW
ncbi:hypothetical protein JX266_006816 [Neoarthrinium moseri]|nr:hypothetical protein JX266_006816 [Neoarthrinium moseri]